MKQLVIYKGENAFEGVKCLQRTTGIIKGISINFALIETKDLYFDESLEENRSKVLVKILAISSNYRDIALIFIGNYSISQNSFSSFGSEFVGVVVKKGKAVTNLNLGDRVIPDNNYPDFAEGTLPGIPSNRSFKEFEILNSVKLLKIPDIMTDEEAAGFSIGAQTGYSIIDKLNITGGNVLITGIKSNTSLFILNILKKYNVNIYGTSSNLNYENELKKAGLKKLIKVPSYEKADYMASPDIEEIMKKGGFDYIIDPFSDINMFKCLALLKMYGKYITCGIYDQFTLNHQLDTYKNFTKIISNNLTIMGNCLGTTTHLNQAINDYISGSLNVHIARVFTSGDDIMEFINLSYNPTEKILGKIVFSFK